MGLSAPHLRRRRPVSSSETTFSSNVKGILMATFVIVAFMVFSHGNTNTANNKNAKPSKPALHDLDVDKLGYIPPPPPSSSSSSSANNKNKDDNSNKKNNPQPTNYNTVGDGDDDRYTNQDDMYEYQRDVNQFELDIHLLDAQSILDYAIQHFQTMIQEQLLTRKFDIDNVIQTTMKQVKKQIKDLNDNQVDKAVKLNDSDLEKLYQKVQGQLQQKIDEEIQNQCNDLLEDLTIDMEVAVESNEEFEEEGEGEAIDLEMEEEEIVESGMQMVDEIVEYVLQTNVLEFVFIALKGSLEQFFKDKYGGKRKFVVDVNKREFKVTGWHENLPPKPKPTVQNKSNDEKTNSQPKDDKPENNNDQTNKDVTKKEEDKPKEVKKEEKKVVEKVVKDKEAKVENDTNEKSDEKEKKDGTNTLKSEQKTEQVTKPKVKTDDDVTEGK